MTEVRVVDWRESVRWYRDVLGLRVVLDDPAGRFTLLEAGPGRGRVALKHDPDPIRAEREAVRLVFEVADLDGFTAELSRQGIPFDGPKSSVEGYREVKLLDPDGTPIGVFGWDGPPP